MSVNNLSTEIRIVLGSGHIATDVHGIQQLWNFHDRCKLHKDCSIIIDLDEVYGIDGNLCALLGIILYSLQLENGITFSIDALQVREKCNVWFSNDFLRLATEADPQQNGHSVKFKAFYPDEKDNFINYLADELLAHEGMADLTELGKEKIIDDLTELYGNIQKHAGTNLPFFVCGQYFPENGILKFTIADLGDGFYPKIKRVQPEVIHTHSDAIVWALNGNSTKTDAPGGKGLINIKDYLYANNGLMQVFSGHGGWNSSPEEGHQPVVLSNFCKGATINLIFSKNKLISDDTLRYG